MNIDFGKVHEKAQAYQPAICRFLRDMIAIPSESRREAEVIGRISRVSWAVSWILPPAASSGAMFRTADWQHRSRWPWTPIMTSSAAAS